MAKFYVQSGTLKAVIDSADAERAALWAVHQAMQQIAPVDEVVEVPIASVQPVAAAPVSTKDFIALGDSISLSEVGFDRDDAVRIDTFEAFREWHALWHALEKLEKML